ncbi:unnamed protein product, partial [Amoebophrya sp. A120]
QLHERPTGFSEEQGEGVDESEFFAPRAASSCRRVLGRETEAHIEADNRDSRADTAVLT